MPGSKAAAASSAITPSTLGLIDAAKIGITLEDRNCFAEAMKKLGPLAHIILLAQLRAIVVGGCRRMVVLGGLLHLAVTNVAW